MAGIRLTRQPKLTAGRIEALPTPPSVGLVGGDLQRLRPVLTVAKGDRVQAGDRLFSDRKRPWITAVAPLSGQVSLLETGPRRSLSGLEIAPDGTDAARQFRTEAAGQREGLTEVMVEAGIWATLRSRPFGRVPDPEQRPDALIVTLTAGRQGAPDPAATWPMVEGWFRRGLAALPILTSGPVFLCHPPGLVPEHLPGVTRKAFRAGLPSAHIHRLWPVAHGGTVWQMPWQEVVALGHLLETGRIWSQRIVALCGPAATRPGLIFAPPGARLHDIAAGRLKQVPLRLLAGDRTGLPHSHLRAGTDQITAQPHREAPRPSALRRLITATRPALIPNAWDEALCPAGIPAIPLLRALASGDALTARDLGVLGLIEEDLALLSHRLGGGPDYTALLRQILDELEALA